MNIIFQILTIFTVHFFSLKTGFPRPKGVAQKRGNPVKMTGKFVRVSNIDNIIFLKKLVIQFRGH